MRARCSTIESQVSYLSQAQRFETAANQIRLPYASHDNILNDTGIKLGARDNFFHKRVYDIIELGILEASLETSSHGGSCRKGNDNIIGILLSTVQSTLANVQAHMSTFHLHRHQLGGVGLHLMDSAASTGSRFELS